MLDLQSIGRILVIIGIIITLIGLALMFGSRFLPWLGRLPGDFRFQQGNISCFFPLATSIILSIVLTIVLNLIVRLLK